MEPKTSRADAPSTPDEAAPLFVLSCARSGSTLTRLILDTHPDVYSPAELDLGATARRLYTMIARLEGRDNVPFEANPHLLAQVREILGGLMSSHTRRRDKRVWCEKSPENLGYQELLARVFPEARFVCLYRHCRDVARSCLDVSRLGFIPVLVPYIQRTPEDSVTAVVRYWVDGTAGMLDFERRRPERTFRLVYERLVADPEATLAPLFGFLGLAWDPSLVQRVFSAAHDRGIGDSLVLYSGKIHRDSVGSGRSVPLDTLADDLRGRMEALLHELGYAGLDPAAEAVPQPEAPARPAAAAGGAAGKGPRWVFETVLPRRLETLDEPPFEALSCRFAVRGADGGDWVIRIDGGGFQILPESREAAATVDIAADDLLDIVHGRQNALRLVMDGKAHVAGDIEPAMLEELVKLLRVDL